jgi:hypothetical protein
MASQYRVVLSRSMKPSLKKRNLMAVVAGVPMVEVITIQTVIIIIGINTLV